MVDLSPELAALIVALAGFVLWLVTQLQILRAVRAIKADIDMKRQATQDFVTTSLANLSAVLQGDLSHQVGGLQASIPPAPDLSDISDLQEKLEAFRADFANFAGRLGQDMKELPTLIGRSILMQQRGTSGGETMAIQALGTATEKELEGAVSIQEALASQDPEAIRLAALRKIASFEFTDKYKKEHPLAALALELGKPKLMEIVQEGLDISRGGRSAKVTYNPTKGPYGV